MGGWTERYLVPAQRSYRSAGSRPAALCGEFNNWSAQDIRLERGDDGSWQATVALEPGRSYRYRYLLDGERWENAWQAGRYVPNSHGGTDSVIIVE
jgi:1,4-alpha-glucan branching enzyme